MPATEGPLGASPLSDLTRSVLGKALTMDELLARFNVDSEHRGQSQVAAPLGRLWAGSVGYERHRDSAEFARRLHRSGVRRLIDVRELPISRRRGYAKTALGQAMAAAGVQYLHVRALGNPKRFRDLYKAGRVEEGRAHYELFLREERRDALQELVGLIRETPSALMCVEHDPATCHRTSILDALRDEFGVDLDVVHID
jgi:uncharacterized protein (DUF488 family)